MADSKATQRASSRRAARVWNALTCALWPMVWLYTLRKTRGKNPKSRAWLRQAWGNLPANIARLHEPEVFNSSLAVRPSCIWIHAVSVGETVAAREIARALRENEDVSLHGILTPRIVLSSTTETGHQTALALLRDKLVDEAIYFPVDVPFAVRRALQRVRPDVVVLVETELWPTFLHEAHEVGARVVLANGRVSDNLLKTAKKLAPLYRWMLGNVDAALMRSDFDAARMRQLPAPEDFAARVQTVGDVKLDRAGGAQRDDAARAKWREILGVAPNALFWVAGSTHAGEDEMMVDTYVNLCAEFPDLRLLIAPRHIERAREVETLLQARDLTVAHRSQQPRTTNHQPVLLLDTVGELAEIYAACDVAFVGGSLIPRGGHNLLEPVLVGAPVVFGPHVQNFREAAQLARDFELGTQIKDADALQGAVAAWLRDEPSRAAIPERANRALSPHQGAAHRVAEVVTAFFNTDKHELGADGRR